MRLHRLTLRNVRGVEERTLDFSDGRDTTGVVIVEGRNEAGKSTLGDALDALLAYKDNSRHADVRSLKTVDRDEAPEVEAELEVGDHRFVYGKQFLKRTGTELSITAPRGETVQGDEAHSRVERLLADHLDVGLWASLRLRQGQGLDQAGPGGSSGLATALSGRSDASAIGDRELAILEQVRAEYERYYTAKAGTPKPLLRDAEAAVTRFTERLADVDRRRSALQEDIERADRLTRSLPGLREQVDQADARAKEHADALAEVTTLAERVEHCERTEQGAATLLAHLRERHERRTGLVAELAEVERERTNLAEALVAAEQRRRDADARLAAARDQLQAAQEHRREARLIRQGTQRDLDHLQGQATLTALSARAGRAGAALERVREAEAEIAGSGVDDERLAALRAAQTDLTRAEAALDAASPELRFTAARSVRLTARGEPVDLEAGAAAQWTVHGTLELDVGEVGHLEVSAGAGTDDAAETHRRAVERLRDLLEEAGVDDLAAAEAAVRRRREAERTVEEARRERATALDGQSAEDLAEEIDRLERQLAADAGTRPDDTPLPHDPEQARASLQWAVEAERLADESVAGPEAAHDAARAELEQHREALVEQRTRTEETARRADAIRAELEDARDGGTDEELATRLATAEADCARARTDLDEAREKLSAADPDTVTARAGNAEQVARDARTRLVEAEQDLRDTRVRIAALGGDGLWEQRELLAAELVQAQGELEGLQRRATAARTLLDVLEHHRGRARERYAAPLRSQLLAYGRVLHGPEFDVEFDDDLRVSRRHLDGVWLDVADLSVGAREQLALLGRLACATLLGEQGGLLLFDDALGNTDPERLELIGAVLRMAGEHSQVIVLTCYPERYHHVGGARRISL